MKKIYFLPPFPEEFYNQNKIKTFRLDTDRSRDNFEKDEEIGLWVPKTAATEEKEFGRVFYNSIKYTTFRDLTEEDWEGHERFRGNLQMLMQYKSWNNTPDINLDTKIKIIGWNWPEKAEEVIFKSEVLEEYLRAA